MSAGGNAAANAIHDECRVQDLKTSVIGVPKSIDNDIQIIDRCFGFESAVDEAQRALLAAKVEARSALRYAGRLAHPFWACNVHSSTAFSVPDHAWRRRCFALRKPATT